MISSSRRRVWLLVGFVLSLLAAAQWGATARAEPPGTETRFIQTGMRDGVPTGHFTARIGGRWVLVDVDVPRAPLPPLLPATP